MDITLKITAVFYFAAVLFFLFYLTVQKDTVAKIAVCLYSCGFVLHTIGIAIRYFKAGYAPIVNLHEGLSFLSWSISGFFLAFYYKYKIKVMGAFISPLSFIFLMLTFAFSNKIKLLDPALQSFWRPIHITFSFLGDAMFAIAALVGVMYLLQERQIKKPMKRNKLYDILPDLNVADAINYKCLTLGFPMLTIGIITGAIWADNAWGTYWQWDPKETWSLVTWLIYAAMLHGRLTTGWRGRKVAILSIIGFAAVVFTFLGVSLLLGGTHANEVQHIAK